MREDLLARKIDRANREIEALETLIEDSTRSLYLAQERLRESARFIESVLGTIPSAVLVVDSSDAVVRVNTAAREMFGREEFDGISVLPLLRIGGESPSSVSELVGVAEEVGIVGPEDIEIPVLLSASAFTDDNGMQFVAVVAHDLRSRRQLEIELRHAQKLESVGQLAAGIAHEINTPIQFASDSVHFLREAFEDMGVAIEAYRALRDAAVESGGLSTSVEHVVKVERDFDMDFLVAEVPQALSRATDGMGRVASIVRAMKAFSHPGGTEMAPADLHHLIETTLEVCRNEYRYVADLDLDLGGDVPPVICNAGDINQVVLNLVPEPANSPTLRI